MQWGTCALSFIYQVNINIILYLRVPTGLIYLPPSLLHTQVT